MQQKLFTVLVSGTTLIFGAQPDPKDVREQLTHYLSAMARGGLSASIYVARDGDIVLSQGFGMADQERSITNTPQTIFDTASMTKLITALVAVRLEELGSWRLDDLISQHLPADIVPEPFKEVTLRHLLEHSSGLDRGGAGRGTDLKVAVRDHLSQQPKFSPPGSKYGYSNCGYAVLAACIEHTTGKPFEEAARQHVLEPARIDKKSVFCGQEMEAQKLGLQVALAHGGAKGNRPATTDPYPTPEDPHCGFEYDGMGGWVASVEAVAALIRSFLDGNIVSKKNVDRFFKSFSHRPYQPEPLNEYCLFREVFTFPDGKQRCFAIGGEVDGFTSKIWYFPDHKTLIVVLSNQGTRPSGNSIPFKWGVLSRIKAITFGETTR